MARSNVTASTTRAIPSLGMPSSDSARGAPVVTANASRPAIGSITDNARAIAAMARADPLCARATCGNITELVVEPSAGVRKGEPGEVAALERGRAGIAVPELDRQPTERRHEETERVLGDSLGDPIRLHPQRLDSVRHRVP